MNYYPLILYLAALFVIFLLGIKLLESKRSERTLQRLMSSTYTGYCKYRYRDGVIIEVNDSFIDIMELNMKKDEILGHSLSELIIYVEDEEDIRERIKKSGSLKNYEYHFKTLKGKDKCAIYNSYMIRNPQTGEEVIEALIKDATEEKSSYQKTMEAEERYRKLFMNSGDMVVIYKFDTGIIEEVNPVTGIVTGYTEDELIGQSIDLLFHPSSRKGIKETREDLVFQGASRLEGVIVCKNGTYKETSLTLSTFEIKDEKIVMAVVKDISEMVREKEEQGRRKKELEDFWKTSVEREERIKDLRKELQMAKQQIKLLKEKYGIEESEE
jgi:PAS domain S-box-containing protein